MFNSALTGDGAYDDANHNSPDSARHVYVIDDDREVRRSLHCLLATAGIVTWPFGCASDFIEALDTLTPAPILLDIRMHDVDGLQLMQYLRDAGIDWPVIIVTAHGAIDIAVRAIKLGAIEFLEKPFDFEAVNASLLIAFENLSAVKAAKARKDEARILLAKLSPREWDVIHVLVQGLSNKAAAQQLSLSVRTIEMHRASALHKLNIKSIAQVTRLAKEAGVDMPDGNTPGSDVLS